jgi:glutaminyl-peptide cyclotransferase
MQPTTRTKLLFTLAFIGWLVLVVGLILGLILVPRMNDEADPAAPDSNAGSNSDSNAPSEVAATAVITFEPVVIETHPHDPAAYTQGLEFLDGVLIESTGLVGESSLRRVEPNTGEVLASVPVPEPLFAEGATVVGDEIWQLTWRDGLLLTYSADDLAPIDQFTYQGEGWGLCATETDLIMSNGSDRLSVRDRESFALLDSIPVTLNGRPVDNLNELECVAGTVWANVWQSTDLLAIDPATGRVTGVADLSPLLPPEADDTDNVVNGIAYQAETGRFWLTGKRWSVIHEVELRPTDGDQQDAP